MTLLPRITVACIPEVEGSLGTEDPPDDADEEGGSPDDEHDGSPDADDGSPED